MIKAWAGLLGHRCGHHTMCLLGAAPALEELTCLWCLTLHQVQEKEASAWPQLRREAERQRLSTDQRLGSGRTGP